MKKQKTEHKRRTQQDKRRKPAHRTIPLVRELIQENELLQKELDRINSERYLTPDEYRQRMYSVAVFMEKRRSERHEFQRYCE